MSSFLNQIFSQLIEFSPLLAVFVLSFIITLIMTLIYKYTTDQKRMKELRERLGQLQKEAKAAASDPKKMMKINSEMMTINGEYMKHSLKPMLISWIPVILIFAWMSANLAYEPIMPGQEFNITLKFRNGIGGEVGISSSPALTIVEGDYVQQIKNGTAQWLLRGDEGLYTLTFTFQNKSYEKKVLITNRAEYEPPITQIGNSNLTAIEIGNRPRKVIQIGKFGMGWFWAYFIFALILNSILRKIMKVY